MHQSGKISIYCNRTAMLIQFVQKGFLGIFVCFLFFSLVCFSTSDHVHVKVSWSLIHSNMLVLFCVQFREIEEVYSARIPPLHAQPSCRCPSSHPRVHPVVERYCIPNGANDTTSNRVLRLHPHAHPLNYINDNDIGTTWVSSVFSNLEQLNQGVSITIDLESGQYQVAHEHFSAKAAWVCVYRTVHRDACDSPWKSFTWLDYTYGRYESCKLYITVLKYVSLLHISHSKKCVIISNLLLSYTVSKHSSLLMIWSAGQWHHITSNVTLCGIVVTLELDYIVRKAHFKVGEGLDNFFATTQPRRGQKVTVWFYVHIFCSFCPFAPFWNPVHYLNMQLLLLLLSFNISITFKLTVSEWQNKLPSSTRQLNPSLKKWLKTHFYPETWNKVCPYTKYFISTLCMFFL